MRQLTCTAPGRIEWCDVTPPQRRDDVDALVRPVAVARCEIDPVLVLAGPGSAAGFALGHEAVAEVLEVGAGVSDLRPGQLVLCSFQICCGACRSCRAGFTANCDEQPILSDFGMQPLSGIEFGGMLSDAVRVPYASAMLVPAPEGFSPVQLASVPDNVADGYRAVVPHLRERPGADVLVACHGTPSIALYAAQAAVAFGAETTFASDHDKVLGKAEEIGATALRTDFVTTTGRWPIVVDCGTRVEGLQYAVASTAPEGILHSVSYYATPPRVPLPLGKLYTLGITFHIGRAHAAALLPEVVAAVVDGHLEPWAVTTSVIQWEDAPSRFLDDSIKLVVAR